MWNKIKFPLSLLVITSLLLIIGFGSRVFANKPANPDNLPLEELRTFVDVFAKIKSDYVEDITDKELLENAIRGMLSGLDPHSTFLDADEFGDLNISTSGEFGGLGIEVNIEDGYIKVVAPIDDTPAQQAGILSGDIIIRLDDTPVKDMPLDKAIKKMRGKPGSEVSVTVLREGIEQPITFNIQRAIIKTNSVRSRILSPGYVYLRISQFQYKTGTQLLDEMERITKQDKTPLKGLILDLRNNPGGSLDAAIEVSDAFLSSGTIVSHAGRAKDSNRKYSANPEDIINGKPLAVLVNGGSASASEIVAGAIQDHSRGIIIGTKTFGKGSVQTILPIGDGYGVKLTTAKYFTPNGRSIQAEGIQPDIIIDEKKVLRLAEQGNQLAPIKEADLSGRLDNPKADQSSEKKSPVVTQDSALETDYALQEALNLLKGLNILNNNSVSK